MEVNGDKILLTKGEWRKVVRDLKPKMTDEEFNQTWERFQKEKAKRTPTGPTNTGNERDGL